MSLQKELKQAIARISSDCDLLHQIIHGNGQSLVSTESGKVKTMAKAIADVEALIQFHMDDLHHALEKAGLAQKFSEGACERAFKARDEAWAAVGSCGVTYQDTHPGKLNDKIIIGNGLEETILNPHSSELLKITVSPYIDISANLHLAQNFV